MAGVSSDSDRASADRISVWFCGHQCHARPLTSSTAIVRSKAIVIGLPLLQSADADADSLRNQTIIGSQIDACRIAIGGGQAVFKLRRGGDSVRIHRAVEGGARGAKHAGSSSGDYRGTADHHAHCRIAIPSRRGEAGAAAGVIHRETTGGRIKHP